MTMKRRSRFSRLLAFGLLLMGTFSSVFASPARTTLPGLPNFHTVAAGVYRGGAPTRKGLEALRSLGVQTIIDLRIERSAAHAERSTAQTMGFTWLNLTMGRESPTQQQVDAFLAALAKAPETPVFVHCQHGADRTGCMVGIYRVQVQGWPFLRAWAEMRKCGFKPYLSDLKAAVRSRSRTR